MPEKKNYLLGYGERLTEPLLPPKLRPTKNDPYTFERAKERLAPRINRVADDVAALPAAACPNDQAVAVLTLHPRFIAKTSFPSRLLSVIGLEAIGSRAAAIVPDEGRKKPRKETEKPAPPKPSPTTDIYVAGDRSAIRNWATNVTRWTEGSLGVEELGRIEDMHVPTPEERLRPVRPQNATPLLEVVLQGAYHDYVIEGFRDYLKGLDIKVDLDRRQHVEGLCFLAVRAPRHLHKEIARFAFLRVAREMPTMRELRPAQIIRSVPGPSFPCILPDGGPVNPELRVAVFDGGVPKEANLQTWVNLKELPGLADAVPAFQAHGLAVTSALLFGSLENGKPAEKPFAPVDHYRVLDEKTKHDPESNYYQVLERITSILSQQKYDFVNLSVGPEVAFDDDVPHLWTVKLDKLFSDGRTFVSVAAGNTGELGAESGAGRIQSPSDGVNVLCVGACDSLATKWKRAPYSSLGPGRSPGFMKPDVVAFGGSAGTPFWALGNKKVGYAVGIEGTSFSSPLALRTAIGVRAHLGPVIQALALKALLIHHSKTLDHPIEEVGWGQIPYDIEDLITCGSGIVHILYQDKIERGKYVRAAIPVPSTPMNGAVEITATFCYSTEIDPEHPDTYTRAGLDIKFRPDKDKRTLHDGKRSVLPDSAPFFQIKSMFSANEGLRHDAHQWETCVKRSKTFRAASLKDPAFDIHYNARKGGHQDNSAQPIPYALVVTVHAKNVPDLYNRVVTRYRTRLEPLRSVLRLTVHT
jgi:hypothetical protein